MSWQYDALSLIDPVTRFSTSGFIHQTTTSGPRANLFTYGFVIAEMFEFQIDFLWSPVSMTPPITGQRCK
jgi:hypothetical protein